MKYARLGKKYCTILAIAVLLMVQNTNPALTQPLNQVEQCEFNTLERVLAFSPDSKLFFAGWDLETGKFWSLDKGIELHQISAGRVTSAAFSKDGKLLLTGNEAKQAILWDVRTGNKLRTFLHKSEQTYVIVETVAFLPDGKTVFTSDELNGYIWDIETGAELNTIYINEKQIKLSPDGKRVLADGLPLRILDIETGRVIYSASHAISGDFSPDGKYIVTEHEGVSTLREAQSLNKIHDFPGTYPHFSPTSRYLYTIQNKNDVVLWDINKRTKLNTFTAIFLSGIVFSPNNDYLLLPTTRFAEPMQTTVRLWDIEKASQLLEFEFEGWPLNRPVVSPDGTYIGFALESDILIWDVKANKTLYEFC